MLVIFEGPDGSGKSTLVKRLKQKYLPDALICKRNSFKTFDRLTSDYDANIDLTQSALYDWRFFLEMHADNFASHQFICDRSFITQVVYQNATGPDTKTSELDSVLLSYQAIVSKMPHLLVYCDRDSVRNDGDYVHMNGKEQLVIDEYAKYIKNTTLNTLVLDTNALSIESCTALIMGAITTAFENYKNNESNSLCITTTKHSKRLF